MNAEGARKDHSPPPKAEAPAPSKPPVAPGKAAAEVRAETAADKQARKMTNGALVKGLNENDKVIPQKLDGL